MFRLKIFLLFGIDRGGEGRPSLLAAAVSEVTVRSLTPIFVAFVVAIFIEKRAVNPSEETGGPQHYLQIILPYPPASVRVNVSSQFAGNNTLESLCTSSFCSFGKY